MNGDRRDFNCHSSLTAGTLINSPLRSNQRAASPSLPDRWCCSEACRPQSCSAKELSYRRWNYFHVDGYSSEGKLIDSPFYYPEFLVIPYPMAEKFTARLRRRGERIWRAIDGHPFLQQLHAGTLLMNRFTYFILQDYVYLLDFAQVLCHAGSKSPNLETLELFARHALGAIEVERSFHESFGRSLGLSPKQL